MAHRSIARLTWYAGTPEDPVGAGIQLVGFGQFLDQPALPLGLQQQVQQAAAATGRGVALFPRGNQSGDLTVVVHSARAEDPRANLAAALAAAAAGPLQASAGWVLVEVEDPDSPGTAAASAALTPAALPAWRWLPPVGSYGQSSSRAEIRIQFGAVQTVVAPPSTGVHLIAWDDSSLVA